jgi:tetratricopeptide (TPR) repeat protein
MSSPTDPGSVPQPTSPNSLESKFLSRFVDTDALFVRPTQSINQQQSSPIALVRFQQLEQEIRHHPANAHPYVELGQIYLNQQRWADAKRVLETGVQSCPEHEPLLVMREDLILHQANQLVEQAKIAIAQKISDETKYALEQAEINFANERIRVCKDRFGRHPEQTEILINWAIGLRQLGRYDEAIDRLTQAANDPEFRARASLQLGMCYQTLSRPLEALSAFRKASLYRSPMPEPKIRQRALELALDLAEELHLVDSARFYAGQALIDCEPHKRTALEQRLRNLESQSL